MYQGSRGRDTANQFETINGSPQFLGTIQSTGTNVISNLSGAITKGMQLMVQPDAAGYINPANHPTTPFAPNVTNSASNGVALAAQEKYYIALAGDDAYGSANGEAYLQWISATGTTNLKVWRLR